MTRPTMDKVISRRNLICVLIAVIFMVFPFAGQTKTWLVGPDFLLKKPSEAIKHAQSGDIIKIVAGLYQNDYGIIHQDNLILEGVGGFAHLKSSGPVPGGKAIWVINGTNITIRNIAFSGAKVPHKNGAGIRLQRGTLTLDNCYFQGNEMGILTAAGPHIRLLIKNSEFNGNAQDYPLTGKLSHNIYVGMIAEFIMENSISRGAQYGHAVKSRAKKTIITNNRIFDEGDISASYLIDIPNGGKVIIENNYLYKNKNSPNNALISYGAEGMKYENNSLTLKYNTAINAGGIAFLLRNHSNIDVKNIGNKLTRITASEIAAVEKDGFWDRMKNRIRNYLKSDEK